MEDRPQYLLLTIMEAADEVRLSDGFIKKEIREGRLLARKFGRTTRIERRALEAWIARQPARIVGTPSGQGGSPSEMVPNGVLENTVSYRR